MNGLNRRLLKNMSAGESAEIGSSDPGSDGSNLVSLNMGRKRAGVSDHLGMSSVTESSHTFKFGGEGGIRTHGRDEPTHAFQACAFSHSATSPLIVFQSSC